MKQKHSAHHGQKATLLWVGVVQMGQTFFCQQVGYGDQPDSGRRTALWLHYLTRFVGFRRTSFLPGRASYNEAAWQQIDDDEFLLDMYSMKFKEAI